MKLRNLHFSLLTSVFLIFAIVVQAFEIGHVSIIVIDSDRDRQIPVEVYYPAEIAGESVPVAEPGEVGFPVISFGHGFLMPWIAYENIWEAVVPAGYIVGFPGTGGELLPDHQDFGLDLAYVIRALQTEGENSTSIFYQGVGQTSAVIGHSMGGGASFLAAASDQNISAIVSFAAAETDPSAIESAEEIDIPSLFFAGSDDCVAPPVDHQLPLYNSLRSDCKTIITLIGGSHCQFAEYSLTCSLGELSCPSPGITRVEQHSLVEQFLLPWLSSILLGDHEAWISFESMLGEETEIDYDHSCDLTSVNDPFQSFELSSTLHCRSYPNPFNPSTTIEFELVSPQYLNASVYNIAGDKVQNLFDDFIAAGIHKFHFDGAGLGSGLYIVAIETGRGRQFEKLLLVK